MPDAVAPAVSRMVRRARRRRRADDTGAFYPRWYWPSYAMPATVWLAILFLLPLYTVLAIAFGTVDMLQNPFPVWEPWYWTAQYASQVFHAIVGPGSYLGPVFLRTFLYAFVASIISVVISYPVAYNIARHGGKRKPLYLALLILPFWISYMMRMLAWVNLLQGDGYINRILLFLRLEHTPIGWLDGKPVTVILGLVYGYIPYMILPLYGFLDRLDDRLLEAAQDLGANPFSTFARVTLPLSQPAIVAGIVIMALPMFGDYYTNNMLSNSTGTAMIGNILDNSVESTGQGPQAAVFVLIIMVLLILPLLYYLRTVRRTAGVR